MWMIRRLIFLQFMAQGRANENEYKPGARSLVSLQADEVAAVEYYLYLEGCDEQCSNAVQSRSSEIALAFAGVDARVNREGEWMNVYSGSGS